MSEIVRYAAAGSLVAAAVAGVSFYGWLRAREPLAVRRGLRNVLGAAPESVVVSPGRGRAAGVSLAAGQIGVTWDNGAWVLAYKLEELIGAELVIDGDVQARIARGEPRRQLEHQRPCDTVTLRLLFNDATYPDFTIDLWEPGDGAVRNKTGTSMLAVREGARWLSRVEGLLRRTAVRRSRPIPIPLTPEEEAALSPREQVQRLWGRVAAAGLLDGDDEPRRAQRSA